MHVFDDAVHLLDLVEGRAADLGEGNLALVRQEEVRRTKRHFEIFETI